MRETEKKDREEKAFHLNITYGSTLSVRFFEFWGGDLEKLALLLTFPEILFVFSSPSH